MCDRENPVLDFSHTSVSSLDLTAHLHIAAMDNVSVKMPTNFIIANGVLLFGKVIND